MAAFRYSETKTVGNGRLAAPEFMCAMTDNMQYASNFEPDENKPLAKHILTKSSPSATMCPSYKVHALSDLYYTSMQK